MARTAVVKPRVRDAVASFMTMRDRVCFASVASIAERARCSERSCQYALRELAEEGTIEECPAPKGFRTRGWRFRSCTLRTTCRKTETPRAVPGKRYSLVGRCSGRVRASGRRRRLMERHPEKISSTGVVRADGSVTPFNAGDAVAAVAELYGKPVPREFRARLGKGAKELLEDGFDPNIVCAAMLAALKLARPHLMASLAVEIQDASEGDLLTFQEYRSSLRSLNRQRNPQLRNIHDALEEAFRK